MSELKEIGGFEGYYISTDGKVYSNWRRKGHGYGKGTEFIRSDNLIELRPCNTQRYPCVTLYKGGRKITKRIHLLVLVAFVSKRRKGKVACHNDGDTYNNNMNNLRWDTQKSNVADKKKHGTDNYAQGESHYNAKLKEKEVIEIKQKLSRGAKMSSLSQEYGVHSRTIWKIARGKLWRHIKY